MDFLLAPYLAEPIGQTDVELGLLGVPSVASAAKSPGGGESTGSAGGEALFLEKNKGRKNTAKTTRLVGSETDPGRILSCLFLERFQSWNSWSLEIGVYSN